MIFTANLCLNLHLLSGHWTSFKIVKKRDNYILYYGFFQGSFAKMCYIRREVTWFKVIFQWNCSATQWVLSGLKQSWTEMHTTSKHLVGKKIELSWPGDFSRHHTVAPSQKVYLVKSVLNYNMSFKYRYCFELQLLYY